MNGWSARRSVALLLVATVGTLSLTRPWSTALGTRVPDVTDVSAGKTPDSATTVIVHAAGAHGFSGGSLLAAGAGLLLIALWRLSPTYRSQVAGYASILFSGWGIAVTVAFLTGAPDRAAAFGSDVEVQQATIAVTAWPWVTLACVVLSGAIGVCLVPSAPSTPSSAERQPSGE